MVRWQILIHRLPPQPSRVRVGIWRDLRRLGVLPLQQAVWAVPELGDLVAALDGIEARIQAAGGQVYRYRLDDLTDAQQERLRGEWNQLREQEYAEIVEECETKFTREVEFELFRNNLTGAEAEEIEADLEKIRVWFARVAARDWFGAARRQEAEAAIAACERLLEDFVERVYLAEVAEGPSLDPPAQLSWRESGRSAPSAQEAEQSDRRAEPSRTADGEKGRGAEGRV